MSFDASGIMTRAGSVEVLTELLAGLVGTAASLHLYQLGFSPSPLSVQADFEAAEADFVGYAPAAITWSAVGLDAAGLAVSHGTRSVFTATNDTTPNNVAGAWIQTTDGGDPETLTVIGYYPFQAPIDMTYALAQMAVEPVLTEPQMPGYCVVDS